MNYSSHSNNGTSPVSLLADQRYPIRLLVNEVELYPEDELVENPLRILNRGEIIFALRPSNFPFEKWIPVETADGVYGRIDRNTQVIELHGVQIAASKVPIRLAPQQSSHVVDFLETSSFVYLIDWITQDNQVWMKVMNADRLKGFIPGDAPMFRKDIPKTPYSFFSDSPIATSLGIVAVCLFFLFPLAILTGDTQAPTALFMVGVICAIISIIIALSAPGRTVLGGLDALDSYLKEYRETGVEPVGAPWCSGTPRESTSQEIASMLWRCRCGEINIRSNKNCRICYGSRTTNEIALRRKVPTEG